MPKDRTNGAGVFHIEENKSKMTEVDLHQTVAGSFYENNGSSGL